jgi:hypothetical protein
MTYHFLNGLLISLYAALGLDLVDGINYVSVITLAAFLLTLVGICQEFYRSTLAGVLAVCLMLTSSSLRFLNELLDAINPVSPFVITKYYLSSVSPFYFNFFRVNGFLYNGNHHNFFYMVAERHETFAMGLMLSALVVLLKRRLLDRRSMICSGCFFGTLVFWHSFVAIAVGGTLFLGVLIRRDDEKFRDFFLSYCVVAGVQFVVIYCSNFGAMAMANQVVGKMGQGISHGRRGPFFQLWSQLWYESFMYGFKLPFLVLARSLASRRSRRLTDMIMCGIVMLVVWLLVIGKSGLIGENVYKWIKILDVLVDIIVAAGLASLFTSPGVAKKCAAAALLVLMTASGLIENVPFVVAKPTYPFADYPSTIVNDIRLHSARHDVFVGLSAREILLAGRKMYFANKSQVGAFTSFFMGDYVKVRRMEVMDRIYATRSRAEFCRLLQEHSIDFVEFRRERITAPDMKPIADLGGFDSISSFYGSVFFVGRKGCEANK